MSDESLQRRIEEVIGAHRFEFDWDNARWSCTCREWCDSGPGEKRVRANYTEHVSEAVTDLLIDLAGHGELLRAIDRMHR